MAINSNRPDSFFGIDADDDEGGATGTALGGESSNERNVASSSSNRAIPSTDAILPNSSALDGLANSIRYPTGEPEEGTEAGDGVEDIAPRARPSSFFGMEQPSGHVPDPSDINGERTGTRPKISTTGAQTPSTSSFATPGTSSSAATTTTGTDTPIVNRESSPSPASIAPSQSASNYGSADRSLNGNTRPVSIAPTLNGPLLDHSHLRPGQQAALLSHNKTLELYRLNAKKTNDPDLIYELAVFMIDAAKSMGGDGSSGGSGPGGSGSSIGAQGKEENDRDELVKEAIGLLRKIADRGHPDAQYFLADCYANGIGTVKNKQDFDKAYPLFVLAAKHGHPDAAYRAGMCYEKGWGCRRDSGKAVQFYRKAGAQSHPGAMYRLGTAELNGDLGLKKSAREGVKWLKRSAEAATPEFPHALHELALLHERGVDNVLFADPEYACELLAQAGEMGYAPSAYKLGVNYEYGRMGCPQDAGLSIHMYNIAAQQNHKEACFALTAWYLVGAPGILPQSDTEAYLWAKKAAEQGLAKAEYAVGYFTEMGIGCVRDMREARSWYRAASEHGDKRAHQRLVAMGAAQPEQSGLFGPFGKRRGSEPAAVHSSLAGGRKSEPPLPEKSLNPRDQGLRVAATEAQRQQFVVQNVQPSTAPFRSAVDASAISPASAASPVHHASPIQMREAQNSQREHAHQMAIQHHQQLQQQRMRPMGFGGPGGPGSPNGMPRSVPPSISSTTSLPQTLTGSEHSHQSQSSRGPVSPPQYVQGIRPNSPPQGPQHFQGIRPNSPPMTVLQSQFQNLHLRTENGSNPLPRPPIAAPHDFLRHGPPAPTKQQSGSPLSPPFQSPRQSRGSMPPANQNRQDSFDSHSSRPPQGAEVAYLQQRPPRPPMGRPPHAAMMMQGGMRPPPFRPQQRQNSAPPSPSSSRQSDNYPTYLNKAQSPNGVYRPGIPVLQQPVELIGSSDAERKKSLWAQLKAI